MKKLITILILINVALFSCEARAGSVTVMWEFPTHREDNTPLKAGDLSYTKVYFHETEKNHWTDSKVMYPETVVIVDKPPGNYEIFATVVDSGGRESAGSNKLQWTITDEPIAIDLVRPNPPTLIIVE